jgi:hypothetical protein
LPILKVRSLETDPNHEIRLTSITAEAPYREPAKFNFNHLDRIMQARLTEVADFFWSLREDPGCFASYLDDIMQHRLDLLPDISGERVTLTAEDLKDLHSWVFIIHRGVEQAVLPIEQWGLILESL